MAKTKILQKDEIYKRQAEICSALAHPIRLMILELLATGSFSCSNIMEHIDVSKTNLSGHLSVLKKAGLIDSKKEGLYQNYRLLIPEIKTACASVQEVLIKKLKADKSL